MFLSEKDRSFYKRMPLDQRVVKNEYSV